MSCIHNIIDLNVVYKDTLEAMSDLFCGWGHVIAKADRWLSDVDICHHDRLLLLLIYNQLVINR